MLLLGIDLGTSSVKVSVVNADTKKCIASAQYPEQEAEIIAVRSGWAEQSPDLWWEHTRQAILKCNATGKYDAKAIGAIGITYQMHGLVLLDKDQHVLRNAIIWCDSRAVEIGETAFKNIGEDKCLHELLNAPGNFTASKLAWVKENEPDIYEMTAFAMLPGDFLAAKLTGEVTTTFSALSEGMLWDFRENKLSETVCDYFGFDQNIFPEATAMFHEHGKLTVAVADRLSLSAGIPVTYKSGDQPNNALSLNVLEPGDVAATAGTSGVIYAVGDQLESDAQSRFNGFAHVNHDKDLVRIGNLLCINGAGIANKWIRNIAAPNQMYHTLNAAAAAIPVGSKGLLSFPFGNGAERMFGNKNIGAHYKNIDFNNHDTATLLRSTQEGIAFAFRYGLDLMREKGIVPKVIKVGRANLFLSDVFAQSFAGVTDLEVEMYETDGSIGAAYGAGIGVGYYKHSSEAFSHTKKLQHVVPEHTEQYKNLYQSWKLVLEQILVTA